MQHGKQQPGVALLGGIGSRHVSHVQYSGGDKYIEPVQSMENGKQQPGVALLGGIGSRHVRHVQYSEKFYSSISWYKGLTSADK